MFRICLISWAVLCSIGIIFVRRNPEFIEKQKIQERQQLIIETENGQFELLQK